MNQKVQIIALLFFFTCLSSVTAQVKSPQPVRTQPAVSPSKVRVHPAGAGLVNTKLLTDQQNSWIEVYELPDYKGKMVRFTKTVTGYPLQLPFTPDRISIRRSNNITLRIKMLEVSSPVETEITADIPNIRINNGGIQGFLFENLPYAEIFEFPDFKGRSVKFVESIPFRDNLGLPFPLTNISVKLSSDEVIAYLSGNCGSNNGYITVSRNARLLNIPNTVCGLRIGKKNAVRMRFNGILSEIHNNDCKRMYGKVQIRMVEKDASGNILSVCKTFDESRMDANGWVTVFNIPKSENRVPANLYDINRYFIADRDVDVTGRKTPGKARLFRLPLNEDRPYELFYFDSLSFRRGDLTLEVKANLGSHHKGCDLCTDYTDNASMAREAVQSFGVKNYPDFENYIQAGRFRTSDAAGGLIGPVHATYLDFSFTLVGYSGYRSLIPYR